MLCLWGFYCRTATLSQLVLHFAAASVMESTQNAFWPQVLILFACVMSTPLVLAADFVSTGNPVSNDFEEMTETDEWLLICFYAGALAHLVDVYLLRLSRADNAFLLENHYVMLLQSAFLVIYAGYRYWQWRRSMINSAAASMFHQD
jgi:hypothetical protein